MCKSPAGVRRDERVDVYQPVTLGYSPLYPSHSEPQGKGSKFMETASRKFKWEMHTREVTCDGGQIGMITISSVGPEVLFPDLNSPAGTSTGDWDIALSQHRNMCSN